MKGGTQNFRNGLALIIGILALLIFSVAALSQPLWTTLEEGKRKQPVSKAGCREYQHDHGAEGRTTHGGPALSLW